MLLYRKWYAIRILIIWVIDKTSSVLVGLLANRLLFSFISVSLSKRFWNFYLGIVMVDFCWILYEFTGNSDIEGVYVSFVKFTCWLSLVDIEHSHGITEQYRENIKCSFPIQIRNQPRGGLYFLLKAARHPHIIKWTINDSQM